MHNKILSEIYLINEKLDKLSSSVDKFISVGDDMELYVEALVKASIKTASDELNGKIEKLDSDIEESMTKSYNEFLNFKTSTLSSLNVIKQDIADLKKKINGDPASNDHGLDHRYSYLDDKFKDLVEQVDVIEDGIRDRDAIIVDMNNTWSQTRTEINNLKNNLSENISTLTSTFNGKIDSLTASISSVAVKVDQNKQELSKVNTSIDSIVSKIDKPITIV